MVDQVAAQMHAAAPTTGLPPETQAASGTF